MNEQSRQDKTWGSILLFGGASETHALLAALGDLPLSITLSVTSEYGRSLLPPENSRLHVLAGALNMPHMARLMREGAYCAVIDATHPYAAEASANISAAAAQNGLPCLRLLRQASDTRGCVTVADAGQAVAEVNKRPGAVLLTTGSKDLRLFTSISDFRERLYARVLPTPESLAACLELGFPYNHIIAMQGPFSVRMNVAIIQEFNIKVLVTKDGGQEGGFPQKLQAARATGCELIVLRRPDESGLTLEELLTRLAALLGE